MMSFFTASPTEETNVNLLLMLKSQPKPNANFLLLVHMHFLVCARVCVY